MQLIPLHSRSCFHVSGKDKASFLQGLITNDIYKVKPDHTIWAAFLTPQGKFLFEFFISSYKQGYLFECEKEYSKDLIRRLTLYKLRSDVVIKDLTNELSVFAVLPKSAKTITSSLKPGASCAFKSGLFYVDPRHEKIGGRVILPIEEEVSKISDELEDEYIKLRISLALPDGRNDLPSEKAILLENGFDELNGIDWEKGCFLGQELTARTKYRGLVRKRLVPFAYEGSSLEKGLDVTLEDIKVGQTRSSMPHLGLGLIKIEAIKKSKLNNIPLEAGNQKISLKIPDWLQPIIDNYE